MRAISLACGLAATTSLFPIPALSAPNEPDVAEIARSINALGLDLYREQIRTADGANVLLSPYSISSSLAMAYMGADGETKTEMQRVLRLSSDQTECGAAFRSLADRLARVVGASQRRVATLSAAGGNATTLQSTIQLYVANRLFVQRGYMLRPTFIKDVGRYFESEVGELDFRDDPGQSRQVINEWVADQTRRKIRDLLPEDQPTTDTRLALVNALYLRAAWKDEFEDSATNPEPFHLNGAEVTPVPTMRAQRKYGYAKRDGFAVVTVPYQTGKLQFVLLVPDAIDGLEAVEKSLTAEILSDLANLEYREVVLYLPKFKLEPEAISLGEALQSLGLRSAFDLPKGSANFDRMAPRKPDDSLFLGAVIHKTWLSLDESGTEAAAATIVKMIALGIEDPRRKPRPTEVRADRPFLFAIQHVDSGACLFLGRVTDPR